MYKIAIQLDAFSKLNPATDTTLAIAQELMQLRHQVFFYQPQNISVQHNNFYAYGHECILNYDATDAADVCKITSSYHLDLAECDLILIRQDPPFDMHYMTSLYLLEMLNEKVLVLNNPRSMRDTPEKLFPLAFPELLPPTMVTGEVNAATTFASQYEQIVIKPLYGHGGNDIIKLNYQQANYKDQIANFLAKHHYIILQDYINEVSSMGDRRILMLNGEILTAFGRMPQGGDFRANMVIGGQPFKIELTEQELHACASIAPELKKRDIFLAGIDLLNGRLLEVNVTSPTGIVSASHLYEKNFALLVAQALEERLAINS